MNIGPRVTSNIVDTAWSLGPLTAIIVAPRTHRKHPTLPKKLSRSFKKMDDRTAEITTDKAPIGVTEYNESERRESLFVGMRAFSSV